MERPTPEQVARERLREFYTRPIVWDVFPSQDMNIFPNQDIHTILDHLDAVTAELAEARERNEALSTLLSWNHEAMQAFGITAGPDITEAGAWARKTVSDLAEARAAIRAIHERVGLTFSDYWKDWVCSGCGLRPSAGHGGCVFDQPAVQRAMEA